MRPSRPSPGAAFQVISGYTPLSAVVYGVKFLLDFATNENEEWEYGVAAVDAVIYLFLPWWTTVLIRLLQVQDMRAFVLCEFPLCELDSNAMLLCAGERRVGLGCIA